MNILVTGAGGYIGRHLIPLLTRAGHHVRALGRRPDRLLLPDQVERVRGNVFDPISLDVALAGVDSAYYLVHSMEKSEGDSRSFAERDREAARNFLAAAQRAGVKQIIYLGGLGDKSPDLSPHLASRIEVGEILQSGRVPVTVLRAAIIVGPWGSSFRMIQGLVQKLPVMITPRWVETLCQPIALDDVLYYLIGSLGNPAMAGETFDIGGPDILSYRQMMLQFADVLGLRRHIIGVPVLTPRLSSYWVNLVTPVPASLARPLIDGLKHTVICRDDRIHRILPHSSLSYRDAVRRALDRQGFGEIKRSGKGWNLTWHQWIDRPPDRLVEFFSNPKNLEPMSPPHLQFRLLEPFPERLTAGTELEYKLRVFGVPVRWRSQITAWDAPRGFQDSQLEGPYKRWDHTHTFEPCDSGSWVHDSVDYEIPFGPLGKVAHWLAVRRQLLGIFRFRSQQFHNLTSCIT